MTTVEPSRSASPANPHGCSGRFLSLLKGHGYEVEGLEEKRDSNMGPPVYYGVPGITRKLQSIAKVGCICRHLEYDQLPEKHVFLIAQKV